MTPELLVGVVLLAAAVYAIVRGMPSQRGYGDTLPKGSFTVGDPFGVGRRKLRL